MEERGKQVLGIEEGTCWDEHWVLYVSQFDNTFVLFQATKFVVIHDVAIRNGGRLGGAVG